MFGHLALAAGGDELAGRELVPLLHQHGHGPFFRLVQALYVDALGDEGTGHGLYDLQRPADAVEDTAYEPGAEAYRHGLVRRVDGFARGEPAGVLVDLDDALLPGRGDDLAEEDVYKRQVISC